MQDYLSQAGLKIGKITGANSRWITTYNHFQNISRLFNVLATFLLSTSEVMRDCNLKTWSIRVAEQLKTQDLKKLDNIPKLSKIHRIIA